MLLIFGLALIINVSTSAAATVTNGTAAHTGPKVIRADPVNNTIITKSQTIKVKFNTTIKTRSPWIELKNDNTVISTKYYINDSTLCITPTTTLATGIKYALTIHTNSISDLTGNGNSLYYTTLVSQYLQLH